MPTAKLYKLNINGQALHFPLANIQIEKKKNEYFFGQC